MNLSEEVGGVSKILLNIQILYLSVYNEMHFPSVVCTSVVVVVFNRGNLTRVLRLNLACPSQS